MDKVDFVLVGSEAVVESGGLINGIGSNQMAIIAKAANKPLYALAERWVISIQASSPTLRRHPATSSPGCSRCRNTTCLRIIRRCYLSLDRKLGPEWR
jgi:hypothetical protein